MAGLPPQPTQPECNQCPVDPSRGAARQSPGGAGAARRPFDGAPGVRLRWHRMRPWFNPTPNLSPRSGADRLFAALAGVGLAVVSAAAVVAAITA